MGIRDWFSISCMLFGIDLELMFIFCTKKCLNRFKNNPSLEQNTYSPKNTQSKGKKASSSKNTINLDSPKCPAKLEAS